MFVGVTGCEVTPVMLTGRTDMTREEFIENIKKQAGLSEEDAERVTRGVLHTLRSQLSQQEIEDIQETLPEDIDDLWEGGWLAKIMMALQSLRYMNMNDFIEQVREAVDVPTREEAERIARVVLRSLKATIPAEEVQHISEDLPDELKDFWKAA